MSIIEYVNAMLARKAWLAWASIVGVYGLMRLPDVLAAFNYTALVHPLVFSYLARLLFDGLAVRPDIALTHISPSNMSLIAPPGMYALSAIAGKVSGIYWVLFASQLAAVLLFYRLFAKVVPRAGALVLTLLGIYYFTRSNWWTADFMIQPLILIGVFLLLTAKLRRGAVSSLILLGQIAGLVIVFKQNIGLFFAILCGTWFFLDAFTPTTNSDSRSGNGVKAAYGLMMGFFAFIPVLGIRLLYLDEWIFYLLPYAIFWVLFFKFMRQEHLVFNVPQFLRSAMIFTASALLLPGLVFFAFGSVIGYGRYWHSLFGMGFKFLHVWDIGIFNIALGYVRGGSVANIYDSFVRIGLFFLPCLVNLFAIACIGRMVFSSRWGARRKLALFRVASIGVMGVFMFFPLEGYHILSTKLFIYVFVAAYFLRRFHRRGMAPTGYALALMLLPVLGLGVFRAASALTMETGRGSPVVQRVVGIPMHKEVATELDRKVEVVRRSVQGQAYYVLDSGLMALAMLVDNRLPQYYVETRAGILDEEAVEVIKVDLLKREYVIVPTLAYANRNEAGTDYYLHQLLGFVDTHYVVVDSYTKPATSSDRLSHLVNFHVLKRR